MSSRMHSAICPRKETTAAICRDLPSSPSSLGERYLGMTRAVKSTILTPPLRKTRPESLTSREREILELIWDGFRNKEIGQRLKISIKTVEAHRANMMTKMRVSNTAQLLKSALQDGMIKIRPRVA